MALDETQLMRHLDMLRELLEAKIDSSAEKRREQIHRIEGQIGRVEAKVDRINGTVREHAETLAHQQADMAIVSRSFERLPCVTDPEYSGRIKEQVRRFGVNWGIVWNIFQGLAMGIIAAKLAGIF